MTMPALSIDYIGEITRRPFHFPLVMFKKPESQEEYLKLEEVLDRLIDEVRGDELHPLALVMQIIGENLEWYDDQYHPAIGENISDLDKVKYLMVTHDLRQKDLENAFGGQANVSKFLSGARKLGKNTILKLKQQFGLSADFFIQ